MIQKAKNRCEPLRDRGCINRVIRSTDTLEGVLGKMSINHEGKAARPSVVNATQDGDMQFVVKVY